MPLFGSFSIGRWFGFKVRIDYSWFLIFGLVVWTFSAYVFPQQLPGREGWAYYAMGTIAAILLFLSVLLHELAHSAVARSRGMRVEGITLFIFGGVAQTRMEAKRPIDEFLVTAVGPLTSFGLAGVFWAGDVAADFLAWPAPIGAVSAYIALLNLVLAVFNLVPGFPLDGGRIFRSIMWQVTGDLAKATRWATRGGRAFGYILVAFGLVSLFQGFLINGLWMAFIGWFLANAAATSLRQFEIREVLSHVPVSRVMAHEPIVIPGDTPVQQAVDEFFLRRPFSAYPVVDGDRLIGMVAVDNVGEVPPDRRQSVRIEEIMRPVKDLPTVDEDATLDEVLSHMEPTDEGRTLVVRDGAVTGILTVGDIGQWIRRARELGIEAGLGRPE